MLSIITFTDNPIQMFLFFITEDQNMQTFEQNKSCIANKIIKNEFPFLLPPNF